MSETVGSNNSGAAHPLSALFPPTLEAPPKNLEAPPKGSTPAVQESAGTTTEVGAYNKSSIEQSERTGTPLPGSSANADPANPTLVPPNLLNVLTNAAEAVKSGNNLFLCCIFAVALEVMMAQVVKMESYHERVSSDAYLGQKDVQKDLAVLKAELQRLAGEIEMYTSFARAVACGASAGINLGMAGSSAVLGARSAGGMLGQNIGNALNSIAGSDSVFSNIASGVGAVKKAQVEALITLLEFALKFSQETSDRLDQDRKEVSDHKNQILQAFMQWMNALYAFIQKG